MGVGGELQTIVFNGKDCRVVYQNRCVKVFAKEHLEISAIFLGPQSESNMS